ncbi:unnamed protein product [Ectocarpus sp. CCAP 1310/34]|nr:unnamed protein product [Ectocarpus sp. CCAP 1310/34]
MVRVGHFCVVAAAAADVCTAFVAPVGQAAAGGLVASPPQQQHARVLVSARSQSSDTFRHHRAGGRRRQRLALQMQSDGPSQWAGGGINVSGEAPFEIRGFSLANAAALAGLAITCASFYEYFSTGGAGGLSGIGFVYGIPIALIGLALKYAELPPAPLQTTPEAEALFEEKATETIRSIKSDVTRHRYGDEAHLDTTVKFLGLVMPQSDYPQLQYISQTIEPNGELGFSMVFQSKMTPFKRWVEPERVEKYVAFFGPGVDAEVIKVDAQEKLVAIKLTTLPPGAQPTPKVAAPPAEETVAE